MEANSTSNSLAKYEKRVVLRNGSTLLLRPIRREDEERLLALFYRLSLHAVYLRFHHVLTQLSREEIRHFCTVDYDNTFALVAVTGQGAEERIIAVGRYYRLSEGSVAEVAFVVEDMYQGKGVGTHLLEELAVIAREKGIQIFQGEVLAENQEMMEVFEHSGFRVAEERAYGVYRVVLDIAPISAVEEKTTKQERQEA